MSSLIQSDKKKDWKPDCAYFECRTILKDEDLGTNGLEKGICRHKELMNPPSCKGCSMFTKEIPAGEVMPEMIGNGQGEMLREAEILIIEQEAARQVKEQGEELWNRRRWRLRDLMHKELKVKKLEILNKRATLITRNNDSWLEDKVKEVLQKLDKKKKLPFSLTNRVFKNRITVDLQSDETAAKLAEFLVKLKEEDGTLQATKEGYFDKGQLQELVNAEVISRDDLKGTYVSNSTRYVTTGNLQRRGESEKLIVI